MISTNLVSSALASASVLYILLFFFVFLLIFGVRIALAYVVGNIAKKKGYSFGGFFLLGLFFFIIGLVIVLCLDDKSEEKNDYNVIDLNQKPQPVSPAEEILQYKKLLDEGIITNEEFEEKKKQLLNI